MYSKKYALHLNPRRKKSNLRKAIKGGMIEEELKDVLLNERILKISLSLSLVKLRRSNEARS